MVVRNKNGTGHDAIEELELIGVGQQHHATHLGEKHELLVTRECVNAGIALFWYSAARIHRENVIKNPEKESAGPGIKGEIGPTLARTERLPGCRKALWPAYFQPHSKDRARPGPSGVYKAASQLDPRACEKNAQGRE